MIRLLKGFSTTTQTSKVNTTSKKKVKEASNVVTHRSTSSSRCCLASESGRVLAFSTWYEPSRFHQVASDFM